MQKNLSHLDINCTTVLHMPVLIYTSMPGNQITGQPVRKDTPVLMRMKATCNLYETYLFQHNPSGLNQGCGTTGRS